MASCKQINGLFVPYVDGEASDSERLILEQHLDHCEACRADLEAVRETATLLFEALIPHRLQNELTPRVMAHLPEMDPPYGEGHELTERVKHPERRSFVARMLTWVPVAVPVMLVLMGMVVWTGWPRQETSGDALVGAVLRETGSVVKNTDLFESARPVRVKDVVLADSRYEIGPGSDLVVGLNGPSQIRAFADTRVKFNHAREVRVEAGEVYFEVGKASRYFRVRTPDGFITVFGTSFGVQVRPEGTRVTVVSGEVQVENEQAFAVLHGGERTDMRPADRLLAVVPAPEAQALQARARSLKPDAAVEKAFLASAANGSRRVLRAEQVFVVETQKHAVNSIRLEWRPDPFGAGHAGYDLYVSDNNLKPLFKEHINASVFADKTQRDCIIATPKHVSVTDTAVLHISVLPDYSTGSIETTFSEVTATTL